MIDVIRNLVRGTDAAVARAYLALFRERRGVLVSFLFHSLFKDEREIARNVIDPLDRTTVAHFRQVIEYYVRCGYRFIGPENLLSNEDGAGKLDPSCRYALLTFDDGYYNNHRALAVLEEFGVPALFFISSRHVRENKCFWWDVLYRERSAQGAIEDEIYDEGVELKSLRTEQIEAELMRRFGGRRAFEPRGDTDRPFTPDELREFARHPLVRIGNHTANHAILTNYAPAEVRQQLRLAQDDLREMTGVEPSAIAYPNGGHDETVIRACADVGLKIGFTVRPEKTALPIDSAANPEALYRIGRFVPHAGASIASQCRSFRSDFQMYGMFRDGYLKLVRGKVAQ